MGRDNDKSPLVMGKCGIGKCNSNGELLLALCSEFELIVTNTCSSRRMTQDHLDASAFRRLAYDRLNHHRDKMDVHSTRAMRGANCWTDHQMLRSKVACYDNSTTGKGQQVVCNTAKTCLGKPDVKHQDWFDPQRPGATDSYEQKRSSPPPRELDMESQCRSHRPALCSLLRVLEISGAAPF
ncbi:hypothetical protein NP493_46g09020 [Ridgeia piscesae]|uniref:Uncharacterized protein n=1 Tax=Ridgeia piscesae TaxID=27915 RepID=A0AAD9UJP1_RIDPI|nr:hypothetical protein NP493_46g09020 [Ridgeia piscesae]